jgi:hypothetical protein
VKSLQRSVRWSAEKLAHPSAAWTIVALGLALNATALGLGATYDDYMHAVALRPELHSAGMKHAPWDLFAFAKDPASNLVLMEEGVFPWWTDPEVMISFLRPLSSFSHWLDHTLWPHSPALMHAHSLLWFALLLSVLWCVYRSVLGAGPVAALALLLYALDDARSYPVAWIANRNALIALTPGFLALYAHHRSRSGVQGGRWWGLAALLLLSVGLAAGEPALPVCGYLVAYAACLDRAPWTRRALSLLPYVLLVIAWRVLYNELGYGALYSGHYLDPGRELPAFLAALVVRLPILMLSQFALPMADLWDAYPLMASWLQPAVYGFALSVLAVLGWSFWPLLRGDARARFFLLGALLAAVPVCAARPEDRVLAASSLGGAALVAMYLSHWCSREQPRASTSVRDEVARPRWAVTSASLALLAIHVVIAPLTLSSRILAMDSMERLLLASDASIPSGPWAHDKTVVLLNPPLDVFAVYLPPSRLARGLGMPGAFRWIATGETALRLERVDAQALKITPDGGFLAKSSQHMFRRSERRMALGQRVQLSDVTFEVSALTADGRPAAAIARFTRPLDSENFVWLRWDVNAYRRFTLPDLGKSVRIPAADLKALMLFE